MTDLQNEIGARDDDDNETERETVDAEGSVTFEGEIKKAYGEVLKTPVPYTAKFTPVKDYASIPEDEFPSKKDILNSVNAARKLNERQKATALALKNAGINKPDPNDPKVAAAIMLKSLEKLDMSQEQKDMIAAVLKEHQKSKA